MDPAITSHVIYTTVSVALTIWVGRTLFSNGQIFLNDAFHGNKEMGKAVNHLLLVGFYLLNMGFVTLFLRFGPRAETAIEIFEFTSTKLGVVLLTLGGVHYFNMFNIARMRRKARQDNNNRKDEKVTPVRSAQTLAEMV